LVGVIKSMKKTVYDLAKYYEHFTETVLRQELGNLINLAFKASSDNRLDRNDIKRHTDAIFLAMRLKDIDYGQHESFISDVNKAEDERFK